MRQSNSKARVEKAFLADGSGLSLGEKPFGILVVTPFADDYSSLGRVTGHLERGMHCVGSCHDALTFLDRRLVAVLICDCHLPDGSWKDILHGLSGLSCPPGLIVASHLADARLWAEVLNLGGYDLLMKPLDLEEASRVISLAWRHWQERLRNNEGLLRPD
jgi:DNA-binding NtrC family response regulator